MAFKKSMARNFLLLKYHAFVAIHPLIGVTFSTPTPANNSYDYACMPDWVFYRDDKLTEAEVMPRLVAGFPCFRPRWEKHLELWKGEPAGSYNDVAEFADFVVKDLYPNGNSADLQRAFDLMEHWLVNGNQNLRELIAVGFLEDVQNGASWQAFGKEVFIPFLGPQSRQAWNEIERIWADKASLMEVVRDELKKRK
jgi:hypothetical protein